ncbi:MAG: hypothetical protein ACYTCU_02860 [Planctomycetota bacterium]
MSTPHWKDLGYLTPDAPDCQRDVWALLGRTQRQLGRTLEELTLRTAEPTWAATLRDKSERAATLGTDLEAEAGAEAQERLLADEAWNAFEGFLEEVQSSGHVASLIVTGYAVLGELGTLPAKLLEEVAGPHARPLCGRVVSAEHHRTLSGLFSIAHPSPTDVANLRRMLRHLNAQLYGVYATWRQSFHVLGVDGEWMQEEARTVARGAGSALGLKVSTHDLAVFKT